MIATNASALRLAASSCDEAHLTCAGFQRARDLIRDLAGISLNESKKIMVASRLAKRLRATGIDNYPDYLNLVEEPQSEERAQFVNALTTNLTAFFREPHHFPILADHIVSASQRVGTTPLTVWSAGCSTGQEPYSIAIALVEAFGTSRPPVRIIASDIDTDTLAFAQKGIYPLHQLKGLTSRQIKQFFLCGTGAYQGHARIRPEIRDLVDFRNINLNAARWEVPSSLAAVFCRNVTIYFDKEQVLRTLRRFASLLTPDGLHFAGHSENLLYMSDGLFRSCGKTVYRVAEGAA
jgi:chemotaxis protein methyltransferase CheR